MATGTESKGDFPFKKKSCFPSALLAIRLNLRVRITQLFSPFSIRGLLLFDPLFELCYVFLSEIGDDRRL